MILVDAECFITPEHRGDFIREVRRIIPTVLKENGCTRYELVVGISGDSYHFFEEWASRKHLDEHIAQPHMQEYFKKNKSVARIPDNPEDLRGFFCGIGEDGGVTEPGAGVLGDTGRKPTHSDRFLIKEKHLPRRDRSPDFRFICKKEKKVRARPGQR